MKPTRAPKRAPQDRAALRFMWYRRAIGHSRSGVSPAWRRSSDDLFELVRAGSRAINGTDRPAPIRQKPREEALEDVVDSLAKADDWTRRLSKFLDGLQPPTRKAIGALVRLGCVPDQFVWCIGELRQPSELERKRAHDSDHRELIKRLASRFDKLAHACDTYFMQTDRLPYVLDLAIGLRQGEQLRAEADRLRAFASQIETRRHRGFDRGESTLYIVSGEVRRLTGTFQDDLVAAVVQSVPSFKGTTPEALRKWRGRYASAIASKRERER